MMETLFEIGLAILFLILLSAFFSSAETALTAASDARMRHLAGKGSKDAAIVELLRKDKDKLISSILIGNNAVNVLASAVATSAALTVFGDSGLVLATLFMTVLLVLFAEVLPKTYAFNHADSFVLRIARPIRWLVILLTPFTIAIRWLSHAVIGQADDKQTNDKDDEREEELRGMIELHGENTDAEGRETKAMLSSVLDLGEVQVDEIMTHRASVSMINAADEPEDILRFVLTSPHTRHPVYQDSPENIIGVLHVKSLLLALQQATHATDISQLAIKDIAQNPYFIPETTDLFEQLQAFRSRREHFALVIDEYGAFQGIVTLEDILEEIVGDIDDETDISLPGCVPQNDGTWHVDGTVTIRDLNRTLNWSLPDDNAATIAGLVLTESRIIPSEGQQFRFYDTRFTILERQGTRLTKIKLAVDSRSSHISLEKEDAS
ncbi:MAG: HlyC/CorC family transporter [Candidatus Puniceispirillaceae bacterium]